jgi:hypothetical protein
MRRLLPVLVVCSVTAGWSCAPGDAAQSDGAHEPAAVADTSDHSMAVAPETLLREPGALRTVRAAVVQGRTGPNGRPFEVSLRTPGDAAHARSFGRRTLTIAMRADESKLREYPCTSCHAGRTVELREQRIADAHAALRVTHPGETGAACASCHAATDVELLALPGGERVTLDHAYRVCARCHFAQTDAWAAGAHGKRLDGWQGRRVVMGCTDCHDPHAPTLDTRLPFRPPRLHRPGRGNP